MEQIILKTPAARSDIYVGCPWKTVHKLLPRSGVAIITDDNVMRLYGDRFPPFPVFSVTPGEGSKQISVVEQLAGKLLDTGIDRSGMILAIGGGVVSDITGFLAAVYMRGIRFGSISTTLLSQVDASVGGKNGVNLGNVKNMIGTIRQPEFVICAPSMVVSLPEDEYLSGLAELIKTAIIGDSELFDTIVQDTDGIAERNETLLSAIIARAVRFKASVVAEDEHETGLRRILNFGHTLGHAIELTQKIKHGFAVASGMELATWFSFAKGFISEEEKGMITGILRHFRLTGTAMPCEDEMRRMISHDKKKAGSSINFVFLEGIGRATVMATGIDEIMEFYRNIHNSI
ncbi:MAG: 3-dehydroquinate synthase [Bacteroidales bacterium]|nr:3-dehydroquinate synthase [Bacteroidales bacterium]